ncbi:MAG: hypothetical protein EOM19_01475 [Candidatus Moranbacteria bacterium]|nr:hypothetical protein [Candidatus Moranbacteria bacterium]
MILELKNGNIKVLKNSCEKTDEALIYLEFKDIVLTSKHTISFLIDEKPLEQIRQNIWKMNHSVHTGKENKIVVIVKKDGFSKIYEGITVIKNYISFGELGQFKLPQVILDLNARIEELEKRIKKLENKFSVI